MFVAGDAVLVHKYASKSVRKHTTHIWMRNLTTQGRFELLGMSEGKDDYFTIYHLLKDLIPVMEEYDEFGLCVDGHLFMTRFHWGGDLAYLLNVLGLQTASSKYWCPDCIQAGTGGNWWELGASRNIIQEIQGLFNGVPHACRIKPPIIKKWINSRRIHYCSLHANISFGRGLVKAFINRAIMQANSTNLKISQTKINDFEELQQKYGEDLDIEHESKRSDLDNYLIKHHQALTRNVLSLKELEEKCKTIHNDALCTLEEEMNHQPTLMRLQQLFIDHNISINFMDCVKSHKSPSVIGDHAIMILDAVDEISKIIELSQEEKNTLNDLSRLIRCILKIKPEKDDLQKGKEVVKSFVQSFNLSPWNYCHLVCSHMIDDMKKLYDNNMYLRLCNIHKNEKIERNIE